MTDGKDGTVGAGNGWRRLNGKDGSRGRGGAEAVGEDGLILVAVQGGGDEAGLTVATCTALPLLTPLTVTLASRSVPGDRLLRPLRLTVRLVAVASVTAPVTPLSKVTLSFAALLSRPSPLMVKLVALAGRSAVLGVTTGAMVATCTALPLLAPSTSTLNGNGLRDREDYIIVMFASQS